MLHLSLNELRLSAKSRDTKGYKSWSKDGMPLMTQN